MRRAVAYTNVVIFMFFGAYFAYSGLQYNYFRRGAVSALYYEIYNTVSGQSNVKYGSDRPFTYWGDSLTAGYGALVGHDFPTLITLLYHRSSVNEGVGGETSGQIRDRFLKRAKPQGPESVVIWAGRNNFDAQEDVERDIAAMVADLNPDSQFLVLGVINSDVEAEKKGGAEYDRINRLNAALASTYGKRFVDVRQALVSRANLRFAEDAANGGDDVVPKSLRFDKVHLNDAGQAVVAATVEDALFANGL